VRGTAHTDMSRSRISLQDFLRSDYLSKSVVVLKGEDDEAAATCENGKSLQQQIMENSVRVALLLARSFIHCSQLPNDIKSLHNLHSIQSSDFFIDFEQHGFMMKEDLAEGHNQNDVPDKKIVIIDIDNIAQMRHSPLEHQQKRPVHLQATAMQILGRLLCSVFSQDQSPDYLLTMSTDDSLIVAASLIELSQGDDYMCDRISQRPRTEDVSVFSQLVDSKYFSLSICRLLSDMIDSADTRGGADTPFTSFQEVLQDLEQMISRPKIFLHDSYYPYQEPQKPVFGRTYCGRKEEVGSLMKIADQMEQYSMEGSNDTDSRCSCLEAVFFSGIAGSGKSYLVQAAGEALQSSGWIITNAKFQRGMEYTSGGIVSAMFDELVSSVVKMKEVGGPADVDYCERISKSISHSIGNEFFSWLFDFLPSLSLLFPNISGKDAEMPAACQLVYPLCKILEAILKSDPNRFFMIFCDDLQWADKTSLSLIIEVLISVGGIKDISSQCLFVGTYRSNEIDDHHPFSIQYSYLQMSSYVNTTEVRLSGLSRNDIVDISMSGLKLPRRIVADLADVIYKKTFGHALYVIELLNSLMNESVIVYSPRKLGFSWNQDQINFIQTSDNVAELIASNLKSLPRESQDVLKILSCFGIQTDAPLLGVLEFFQSGMMSTMKEFDDKGILHRSGEKWMFAHDLIQQAAYEGMSLAEQRSLHLRVGQYLGKIATRRKADSCFLSSACDQVNFAGVDFIKEKGQKQKFANWNLSVGQEMRYKSNFSAALHYYEKGISFLGPECWSKDLQLCSMLHKCAVTAAFALGQAENAIRYTDILTEHLPFLETLEFQVIVLRSMWLLERVDEGVSRGVEVLRRLNVNIPSPATHEMSKVAMANADKIACRYSVSEVVDLCDRFQDESETARNIVKYIAFFSALFWESGSPLFTLLVCEVVKHSLQHGVCHESAAPFARYAMLKIVHDGDYAAGKKWADVSRAVMKKCQKKGGENINDYHALANLFCCVSIWFLPLSDLAPEMLRCSEQALKAGCIDESIFLLYEGWSCSLYGGEKLSIISQSSMQRFQRIAKLSQHAAKWAVCDYILLRELTGQLEDYFLSMEGSIHSLDDLQAEAESNETHMLSFRINVTNLLCSYWKRDYIAAEEHFHNALSRSYVKFDPRPFIANVFFGGLVLFQLYRKLGSIDRLSKGIQMLDHMEKWAKNSPAIFRNKWLLLQAEHAISTSGGGIDAEKLYLASIKAAQDHNIIHEVALAYELLGKHYKAQGSSDNSNICLKMAAAYYTQWGATAVVERIISEYNLDIASVADVRLSVGNSKHPRQWG